MQGTEIKVGNNVKVMPDFIKIYDPKDEDADIRPQVLSVKEHGADAGAAETAQ